MTDPVPFELRRRTPEERASYIEKKIPELAKRFNAPEGEIRLLLDGFTEPAAPLSTTSLPSDETPAKGSIRFVLTYRDDETLNFSIEFEGQGGEDITTVTYDGYGSAGMSLLGDTVRSIGETLGIEVVSR